MTFILAKHKTILAWFYSLGPHNPPPTTPIDKEAQGLVYGLVIKDYSAKHSLRVWLESEPPSILNRNNQTCITFTISCQAVFNGSPAKANARADQEAPPQVQIWHTVLSRISFILFLFFGEKYSASWWCWSSSIFALLLMSHLFKQTFVRRIKLFKKKTVSIVLISVASHILFLPVISCLPIFIL